MFKIYEIVFLLLKTSIFQLLKSNNFLKRLVRSFFVLNHEFCTILTYYKNSKYKTNDFDNYDVFRNKVTNKVRKLKKEQTVKLAGKYTIIQIVQKICGKL